MSNKEIKTVLALVMLWTLVPAVLLAILTF